MTEERRRGVIRVSLESVCKALGIQYEPVAMHVSRRDRGMLEITVSHPALDLWRPGKRLKQIEIKRTYEETQETTE